MNDPRQLALIDLPAPPPRAGMDPDALLPESLRELFETGVSMETIRVLAEAFPGCRVSIPHPGATSGQLVDAVGEERANEIARAVGSNSGYYVPACALFLRVMRNREIRAAYDARMPMAEICRKFRITEPNVRRILAG
jgi:hypothetical protein